MHGAFVTTRINGHSNDDEIPGLDTPSRRADAAVAGGAVPRVTKRTLSARGSRATLRGGLCQLYRHALLRRLRQWLRCAVAHPACLYRTGGDARGRRGHRACQHVSGLHLSCCGESPRPRARGCRPGDAGDRRPPDRAGHHPSHPCRDDGPSLWQLCLYAPCGQPLSAVRAETD